METTSKETPSPVAVETHEYGMPVASGAEPFDETKAVTSPPLTFAPSEDACSDVYGQCGGRDWEGPTCCLDGAICNEWYGHTSF